MTKIEVKTSGDEAVREEYEANGYTLAAVYDHVDGHFLVFLDPGEEPEVSAAPVDPIEDLKAQVADLKTQLATLKTNVEKHDADLSVLAESVASVKGEAVEVKAT